MAEGDEHNAAGHGVAAGEDARAAEMEKLRREVEHLRIRRARRPARTVPAVVLIIVACVLAPLSVVSVWAADFVGNTDRYVATVAPLASDPDVQAAVTDRVTNLVIEQVDVPAQVQTVISALESRGLSGRAASALSGLSGPIEDGVTGFIHSTVARVVASPVFAAVWTNVNRQAHASVVKALTGEGGGAVQLSGNNVNIDLAPVLDQVKMQLVAAGLGLAAKIPTVHTSFTVFSSDTVPKVKSGFRLLQIAGNWLPVLAVLTGAAGVLLALRRRTALIGVAVGIALGMIILGIGLTVGRTLTLQQLPAGASEPAATAVIDAVLHFLRVTIRTVGVLAVVVALGAYLSGPARVAMSVRRYCIAAVSVVRGLFDRAGLGLGPVGPFVHRARTWLTWAGLLIAALVFALWDHPTVAVVAWTTVIVLVALAILEFLDPGAPPHRTSEDDHSSTTAPATSTT
jgi:hypothetical protein